MNVQCIDERMVNVHSYSYSYTYYFYYTCTGHIQPMADKAGLDNRNTSWYDTDLVNSLVKDGLGTRNTSWYDTVT